MGRQIAVVGAGPSGIYAVQALLQAQGDTSIDDPDENGSAAGADPGHLTRVDVLESLPAPYGLLRYGVAPDHPKTKTVSRVLARAFDDPRVRFFGNVHVGRDITREQLLDHYDAVIYATGARYDRDLGIPGEELAGSLGAAQFVAWYSGHPDVRQPAAFQGIRTLVVVGAGNVALDVARISLRPRVLLESTDMPRQVVTALDHGGLEAVHLVCRRGPQHVKFTRVELAELLELPGTRIVLHAREKDLAEQPDHPREVATNLRLFREAKHRWADPDLPFERVMHVHFWTSPTAIEGRERVTGVRVRTAAPDGPVTDNRIDAQAVIRAIGYRGEPIPGLPFDPDRCLIPNEAGEVAGTDGREYVTGWIKRGPTGVIGTNKGDATETVQRLLARLSQEPETAEESRPDVADLLARSGITPVDWTRWHRILQAEEALGAEHGAVTIKLAVREELLDAAFGE